MDFLLVYSIILLPLLIAFIYLVIIVYISRHTNNIIIPTNWPVVGMTPKIVLNSHRIHDYVTDILACSGGAFLFKRSSLIRMNSLCTTNPSDVHHILSKHFSNYPRGVNFRNIFDILGDGFSNTDGELWEFHNKTIMSLLKNSCFHTLLKETIWDKVDKGLMPILEYASKQEVEVDLQEAFQRFAFDTICILLFDKDPKSMALDFPNIPCEKALSEIEESILLRYILPPSIWKLQQLFRFGNEKKLSNAWKTVDQFIYKSLDQKLKESSKLNYELQEDKFKLSTAFFREYKDHSGTSGDHKKFLRDTLLNLMVAGRDTTSSTLSWLFYLLAKNPIVEDKICKEIDTQLISTRTAGGKSKGFHQIDLEKLVYLHGALSEVLRLFPPVPFQDKTPLKPDILPSGYELDHNTTVILCFYSMGRMKSIWGEDCMEFKPERWVSAGGGINHQPSYKFPAFNAGPRSCLGKQMSFTQMKIVAATTIYHYHADVVEGHLVFPAASIILKMQNGLKVRLTKRG